MNWPYPQNGEMYVSLMQAVNVLSHLSQRDVAVRKIELEGTPQPVLWLYQAPPEDFLPGAGVMQVQAVNGTRGARIHAVNFRNCQLRWDGHAPPPGGDVA